MSDIKWVKLATDIIDDQKIKLIRKMPNGYEIFFIWIALLAQAGKANAGGYIMLTQNIAYTEEMLATQLGVNEQDLRYALQVLERMEMIELDQAISIANWEKHQNVDGLEKIKEQNRLRKQEQRKRKKMVELPQESRDCHVTGHAEVTPCHAIDIDKEKDINIPHEATSNSYDEEFENVWAVYPRKVDKKTALKSFIVVRKRHTLEAIFSGVENYAAECKKENREQKFIKHASTFFNGESFNEYQVKPSAAKPIQEMKPIGSNSNWGEDDEWTSTQDSSITKSSGSRLL